MDGILGGFWRECKGGKRATFSCFEAPVRWQNFRSCSLLCREYHCLNPSIIVIRCLLLFRETTVSSDYPLCSFSRWTLYSIVLSLLIRTMCRQISSCKNKMLIIRRQTRVSLQGGYLFIYVLLCQYFWGSYSPSMMDHSKTSLWVAMNLSMDPTDVSTRGIILAVKKRINSFHWVHSLTVSYYRDHLILQSWYAG